MVDSSYLKEIKVNGKARGNDKVSRFVVYHKVSYFTTLGVDCTVAT